MKTLPQPATDIRARGFADFRSTPADCLQGRSHWLMRGQNFWLEWVEFGAESAAYDILCTHETMVFASAGDLRIADADHAATTDVPSHAVAILAPGRYAVSGVTARCAVFSSQRGDLEGRHVINASSYDPPDPRISPTGRPYRRKTEAARVQILEIGKVMASKDKPRLKMLQTETLSVNIVEYDGPRKRAELSPHSHASFEQGSLALQGEFVHHLRAPWGSDADRWRDDEHLQAGSPSLLIVPVEMIHTTEGVGAGHHLLIDLFSPPRTDFIEKGWVFNAGDYQAVVDKEPA